ncbi:MAG: hypothetical protein LIO79_09795 [Rikenellaceae bacterium]|nr:hypothetical protein [Rikenellaceae bacterium]
MNENKSKISYEEAVRRLNAMKQRKAALVASLEEKLREEYKKEGKDFSGLEVW